MYRCDDCGKPVRTNICKYCLPVLYLEQFPHRRMYLTPRQKEVVELLEAGMSLEAICQTLGISIQTLKNHILEAKNRM